MKQDLQTLWDIRTIEQVYFRYCEVIDSKVFENLSDVFLAEAVGDYSTSNGKIQNGLAPLIARLNVNMSNGPYSDCGPTQHNVFNIRLTVDGDTAVGKAHFYAVHQGLNAFAGKIYTCWGQYDDVWVRAPQGWRIKNRVYNNFVQDGPVEIIRATRAPAGMI